ncbi:MAG: TIGR03943 family protein [Actinomycetota bacterium]
MSQRFAALLAVVTGVLALRMTLSMDFLNFIKATMFPWLLLSGVVLVWLGVYGWVRQQSKSQGEATACSPGHSHSLSRAAWLLVLPVLFAGLLEPAPLGSFAAQRQTVQAPRQFSDVGALVESLPAGASTVSGEGAVSNSAGGRQPRSDLPRGAVLTDGEMSLLKFMEITYYDESEALAGVPIKLVGFVVPAPGGQGGEFLLSRFLINCCAADATLMQAGVLDVKGKLPAQDSWVAVTGYWDPERQKGRRTSDGFSIPELIAQNVEPIEAPQEPYLSLADY